MVAIRRVLNELLVNPTASIVPPPDLTENKPAGDRSSRNNDCPEVPDFRPSGFRTLARSLEMIVASGCHFWCRALSARVARCWPSIADERSSSSTCWRSCFSSRNRFARSRADTAGLGIRSFDPRRTLEVFISKPAAIASIEQSRRADYDRTTALLRYYRTLGNVRREHHKRSMRRRNETRSLT
jgi:hypothetical protein